MEREQALLRIYNHYGFLPQINKLMEELGEAVSAASELLSLEAFGEDGGKSGDSFQRFCHLVDELADIANVAEQLVIANDMKGRFEKAREWGIHKTLERIREEEKQ